MKEGALQLSVDRLLRWTEMERKVGQEEKEDTVKTPSQCAPQHGPRETTMFPMHEAASGKQDQGQEETCRGRGPHATDYHL